MGSRHRAEDQPSTSTARHQGAAKTKLLSTVSMKAALATIALLVLALGWTAEAVQVQENGLFFSLEAVKRLQELTENSDAAGQQSPRLRMSTGSLCADPMLPQEFMPLCRQRGASASLARLALVPMDVCEICAFAACTGC